MVSAAPNEKVLQYLERMNQEGEYPDNTPPRSLVDPDEFRSPGRSKVGSPLPRVRSPEFRSPRSKASEALLNSPMSYANRNGGDAIPHDDDDGDSNIQVGRSSEAGDTILPVREPGPHDPPGPKYESYDSGPSFGNFGPLPADDQPQSWSPKPASQGPWNGGQSTQAARVPLPSSEFAMSPRGTNEPLSPRTAAQRAMSPMSSRTRLTTKTGTAYPPLPESRIGDDDIPGSPSPSRARSPPVRSKAASISPSESPSQRPPPPQSPGPAKTPSRSGSRQQQYNGARSTGPGSVMSGGHQSRPFSPYRHAPTNEDLLHAAIRGRAVVIPEEDENAPSVNGANPSKAPSQISKAPSQVTAGKAPSLAPSNLTSRVHNDRNGNGTAKAPSTKQPSVAGSHRTGPSHAGHSHHEYVDDAITPRGRSADELDPEQMSMIRAAVAATPRTSYYAEPLEPGVANHYHDMELCVLLHQESDPAAHDVVKKALRKAVMTRVKKLGMKHDQDSLRQYKKAHHDHNPFQGYDVRLFFIARREMFNSDSLQEPPQWAADIKRELMVMQQRIESLGPKIENLRSPASQNNDSRFVYDGEDFTRTPQTQTVHLQTQPTGTVADSMFQGAQRELVIDDEHHHDDDEVDEGFDERTETQRDGDTHTVNQARDDSPGQQFLEEELYRLRQRSGGSQSGRSHHTWEVAREQDDFNDEDGHKAPSGLPTIPDTNGGGAYAGRGDGSQSPPLPALPEDEDDDEIAHGGDVITTPQGPWSAVDYGQQQQDSPQLASWQLIHARLLSWAVIWPQSEVDLALNSTTRGHQVDEVALSIWSTQTYKRYVRARLTDSPPGIVDRLFVPPNMADAISNAVYNGQHGNACGMLRDLWSPFGLPGMPRLLVVLAKHRNETDHWVVHRYSLPEGTLMTYDSYSGRTIMDGRPLGWWFAIRIAWPNANYPSPDHLEQKMVRLHRPAQLPIDNSVAAAGIWRNILMGSRGERNLDLERLRDLINTEVKNLRQRKILGRLSITPPRQAWEHMN
ncbi:hypothetical protein DXG03_006383 [Asterophora parasitica]|uniref:Uncharacterized protein n=1 Tax=Asterophora parasitica TaxID=117018 RepID=A0A9P7K9C9_9AGAR|nr:hypothetical protein DXG03_006383 [Asterophora parasitica]